jgi:hypothetical protein
MSRSEVRRDRAPIDSIERGPQSEPAAPGKTTLTASLPVVQHRLAAEGIAVGGGSAREHAVAAGRGVPLVQLFGARGAAGAPASPGAHAAATDLHGAAHDGIAGAGGALPHFDRIQQLFGRHDIRDVRAHTDERATAAASAMGAAAYACGEHVAFSGSPTLHTAAHEAAHVVQQRGGVQLKGGVGQAGDPYEQHADAVADLVVAGQSAEALLDQHGGGARDASPPVQAKLRITAGEGEDRVDKALGAAQDGQADPYVQAILKLLKALAGAQADRIRLSGEGDDREVLVDALEGDALAGATPGFQLIQRVVQSAHPVIVDPWTDEALNRVEDKDIPKAKQTGVGVGSKVAFPWMPLPKTRVRTAQGGTESRDTPQEIALGHELIHADHAQRGVWRGDDKTLNHFATGQGERGDYAIDEEIDTVGLGATRRAGDITENDLRGQLGYEKRVSYHAPEMFDTLTARSRQQQAEATEKFDRMVREHNAWHKSMQSVWAQKRKDK